MMSPKMRYPLNPSIIYRMGSVNALRDNNKTAYSVAPANAIAEERTDNDTGKSDCTKQ